MPDFCTKAQMVRYLSQHGVQAWSDHEGAGAEDDDVVADCIEQATDEIKGVLYPLYAVEEAHSNRLVKHWAVVMSCFFLCLRRGNQAPESIQSEFERLTGEKGLLSRVKAKTFIIPGLRQTPVNVPVFSNLTIDRRYRREKIRVIPANSSQLAKSRIEQDVVHEVTTDG